MQLASPLGIYLVSIVLLFGHTLRIRAAYDVLLLLLLLLDHLLHTSQKINTCSDVSVADYYLHQYDYYWRHISKGAKSKDRKGEGLATWWRLK